MNLETFLKNYAAKIIGISMVVCNSIWFLFESNIIFTSFFPQGSFYCFRPPIWTSFLDLIISLAGICIGILIFQKKVNYLKWSLIDLALIVLTVMIFLN